MMSNQNRIPGALRLALKRFAARHPFHAHLAATSLCQDDDVGTMGVTVRQGRVTMLYNAQFVEYCSLEELIGVVHHEINHLLFDHLRMTPDQFPDEQALVIAQEVTVNEFVPEPLPGWPILLANHPELRPNEDTVTRYRRLAGAAEREAAMSGGKGAEAGHESSGAVPKSGTAPPNFDAGAPKNRLDARPLDNHAVWREAQEHPHISAAAIRVAVQQARANVGDGAWQLLPASMRDSIESLCRGNAPAGAFQQIAVRSWRALPWRHFLRRCVGRLVARRPTLGRPPRRFPQMVGVIPGNALQATKPRIMAVIDTSGSVSASALAEIGNELRQLSRDYEVVVVECDAAIHAVYRFSPPLSTVRGRGGTDFRPPLDRDFVARQRADVIVYFTDGCGPAPAQPPTRPLIWCLTAGGSAPAPWGRVIHMGS